MKTGHIATTAIFCAGFLGLWLCFPMQAPSDLAKLQERSKPSPVEIHSDNPLASSRPPRPKPDGGPIADPHIIDLIHNSIISSNYYGDHTLAIRILAEDLSLIARVDDGSHERNTLQSIIIRRFIAQRIDDSVTPEKLIESVKALRDALVLNLPESRTELSLKPLAGYIYGTLKSMEEGRSSSIIGTLAEEAITTGDPALIELAGGLQALIMVQGGGINLSELSEIADESLRESATKHLLLGNYGDKIDTAVSLAAFYLSEDCPIEDNREIAIKLFGRNLTSFPEEVSTVILNSPVGVKRDRAIQQMIYRIAGGDMEMALLWLDHIDDHKIKQRALENIKTAKSNIDTAEIGGPITDPFAAP